MHAYSMVVRGIFVDPVTPNFDACFEVCLIMGGGLCVKKRKGYTISVYDECRLHVALRIALLSCKIK